MIYVSASVHVDNVVDDKRFDKKKKKDSDQIWNNIGNEW